MRENEKTKLDGAVSLSYIEPYRNNTLATIPILNLDADGLYGATQVAA